ncbi:glycine receptor subunit alpha-2-like isoform X2 [Centruroides sculpturatus]|nr:glycine receptor subunit alpha-2-like isoform X2 [Centruroides sculpturatus]
MTSEYRLIEVEWLKNMWRPDSFFKNAKQVTFQTMTIPNHYIWLYKNKRILYMVKLTLVLSCSMNFASYPHDTQTCSLQMESLSHTTDDLIFDWDADLPLAVADNIELPQLDLVKTEKADCTQVYSTGNFTCLQVIFTLKRRLGYYLFHTYIPTCLIVIMSWVSFWIKPEAVPARVTLGVTSLLTLSTQHAKSQASLPPVSYIKAIDIFMSFCTVFVFLSLMEYALVNVILEESDKITKYEEERISNFRPKINNQNRMLRQRQKAILVDRISRVMFPSSFIILNVTYWLYFVVLYE